MKIPDSKKHTFIKDSVSLQTRFLIGLAVIFFVFSAFSAILIYSYEKNAIEDRAFEKTNLVMAAVDAAQKYVRKQLRPKMYDTLNSDTFIIEAMSSSFISRNIMSYFNEAAPDFLYRRVAINARNPRFEANDIERDMISYFNENQSEDEWKGVMTTEEGRYFMRFRPIYFAISCYRCHGKPENAPAPIIERYGSIRGFHERTDGVVGVDSVGIPVEASLMKTREVALSVFSTVFLAVFFLYGIICFFFNRMVVQNIREILGLFRALLQDDKSEELFQMVKTNDEINELKIAASIMAGNLENARDRLKNYTDELELKVVERTTALQASEIRLRQMVLDRSRELKSITTIAELIARSLQLAEILPRVLSEALHVVPARGAGIYLLHSTPPRLELQCRENANELRQSIEIDEALREKLLNTPPEDITSSVCDAAIGHMNLLKDETAIENNLSIPLCCRNQVLGVMTFVGIDFSEIPAEMQELLVSIGHQVGITIESLQNMAELLNSRNLLQSVFDGITDIVILVDNRCVVQMVNRAFLEKNNLTMEEVVNRDIAVFKILDSSPFSLCHRLIEKQPATHVVDICQLESGEIFEVDYYPAYDMQGDLENIVCIAKDVTEQKRIEQRLQQTEKLLSLGQLAAGVAHEMNNPLGVILCYADILKESLSDADQALKDIEIIEKHARNCQKTVADLLNFAREHKTVKRPLSLNDIITGVVQMTRTQMRKKHREIVLELSPDIPDIQMDGDKMKQVFMNIIMNAGQAISNGGEISISTFVNRPEKAIQAVIEDTGSGIDKEIINKIFDPFYTTKVPGEGTGLGLSLAYGIIRDHDGDIIVESEPGYWTRFTVRLPLIEDTEENV